MICLLNLYVQAEIPEAGAGDNGYVITGDGADDDGELRLTSDVFTLVVKQGDITVETTDAIVNSTNADLDLSQGVVYMMHEW